MRNADNGDNGDDEVVGCFLHSTCEWVKQAIEHGSRRTMKKGYDGEDSADEVKEKDREGKYEEREEEHMNNDTTRLP